jgi:hypothetical protein
MAGWCLDLDGRRDRDECAKPIVGCGTGPAVDPVAVFSLVRFEEKEIRKPLNENKRPGSCVRESLTSCAYTYFKHSSSKYIY